MQKVLAAKQRELNEKTLIVKRILGKRFFQEVSSDDSDEESLGRKRRYQAYKKYI